MTKKVFNFSAGPAVLPQSVMRDIQAEFLDWQGLGSSVIEISHRSAPFMDMMEQAEDDLRTLLSVPDHYKVLFLQGGATLHFAQLAMNLAEPDDTVSYIDTGVWAKKAIKEAQKSQRVSIIDGIAQKDPLRLIDVHNMNIDKSSRYLHYTTNETINGVEFHDVPAVGDVPLVADMSSDFLSRPVDVERYGMIYAGAQKNVGPSGLVLVIIRDDLLARSKDTLPTMLNYRQQAESKSLLNTPPSFACYAAAKVFKWLKTEGGLAVMAQKNSEKARLLYEYIDQSPHYHNAIDSQCRSLMNIPFTMASAEQEARFVEEAAASGLVALKGHRLLGGMRASLYNAMPIDGVKALIKFMDSFAQSLS